VISPAHTEIRSVHTEEISSAHAEGISSVYTEATFQCMQKTNL